MFWDSSAIVALVVREPSSPALARLFSRDPAPAFWWGTAVECHSAIRRRDREAPFSPALLESALKVLNRILAGGEVVVPHAALRDRAIQLVASYPLRAADALQLAAALRRIEDRPDGEAFVCLDARLAQAAREAGFRVLPR